MQADSRPTRDLADGIDLRGHRKYGRTHAGSDVRVDPGGQQRIAHSAPDARRQIGHQRQAKIAPPARRPASPTTIITFSANMTRAMRWGLAVSTRRRTSSVPAIEQHCRRGADHAEPDHRIDAVFGRKVKILQKMRRIQPVETFARQPKNAAIAQDDQQQGRPRTSLNPSRKVWINAPQVVRSARGVGVKAVSGMMIARSAPTR